MSVQAARAAGIAGIVSFALVGIAFLFVAPPLIDAPDTDATAAEIAAYYDDESSGMIGGLFLYGLAMMFFLAFAAGVWIRLREAEEPPGFVSAVFAFGAVALAVLIWAGFVPASVLAYRAPDVDAARSLQDLTFGTLGTSGFPTALALVAFAALAGRARLPRWSVWMAWIAALVHIVVAGTFFVDDGFFSLEGDGIVWIPGTFWLWVLLTGVALARTPTPPLLEDPAAAPSPG